MRYYDNGEPILKKRMEEEDWYGYYQSLIEVTMNEEFTFCIIEDLGVIIELFHKEWEEYRHLKHYKDFPSEERILRWTVLLTERHNSGMIKAYREEYADLKEMEDWTDWDEVMLKIALIEKNSGVPEFFKDVVEGSLNKNKNWIYTKNELSRHIGRLLQGFTDLDILERHKDEPQWKWKNA